MTTKPVPSRTRRVAVATIVLLGAALLLEAVLLGFRLATGSLATPSTAIYDTTIVAAAILCALRALRSPVDRVAWALMAVAIGCWAFGEVYWDGVLASSGAAVPIPSLSDVFWLAFYLPAYASLALLARTRLRHVGLLPEEGGAVVGEVQLLLQFAVVPLDFPRRIDQNLVHPAGESVANAEEAVAVAGVLRPLLGLVRRFQQGAQLRLLGGEVRLLAVLQPGAQIQRIGNDRMNQLRYFFAHACIPKASGRREFPCRTALQSRPAGSGDPAYGPCG